MNARPRKSTRLTVSLDQGDVDALNRIAQQNDVSLSWVIRQAIRQFAHRKVAVESPKQKTSDAGRST
jgi:predicted transcriptional regulator